MQRPSGYTFETNLDTGNVKEGETYQCKHCGGHTHVKPFQRAEDIGGLCRSCMGLMCPKCTDKRFNGSPCVHFLLSVDEIERAYQRRMARQTYGAALGS